MYDLPSERKFSWKWRASCHLDRRIVYAEKGGNWGCCNSAGIEIGEFIEKFTNQERVDWGKLPRSKESSWQYLRSFNEEFKSTVSVKGSVD